MELRERAVLMMRNAKPGRPAVLNVEGFLFAVQKSRIKKPGCVYKVLKVDLLASFSEAEPAHWCPRLMTVILGQTGAVGGLERRTAPGAQDKCRGVFITPEANATAKLYTGLVCLLGHETGPRSLPRLDVLGPSRKVIRIFGRKVLRGRARKLVGAAVVVVAGRGQPHASDLVF